MTIGNITLSTPTANTTITASVTLNGQMYRFTPPNPAVNVIAKISNINNQITGMTAQVTLLETELATYCVDANKV